MSSAHAALMPVDGGAPLILASGSRFRRQMLENAGVGFSVVTATIDEPAARAAMEQEPTRPAPGQVARRLAALKALEVSRARPDALVIGADQVLDLDGEIFAKAESIDAARAQIKILRGRTHWLQTAVVLASGHHIVWEHLAVPQLTMRAFSDTFLDAYLAATGAGVTETVGGYALEGLGGQLFERIEGDTFSVIGLPLLPLLDELRRRHILLA